jgi:hypothetical protein
MAQSSEAFEQMTAEWPPRERTLLRVFAFESPLRDYRCSKVEQDYGGN